VKVAGKKTTLVRGDAWILKKDSEKEKLEVGKTITPYEVPRNELNKK